MEHGQVLLPDWRDDAAYAPLRQADRAILAWEWLRRVPTYGTAFRKARRSGGNRDAATWGLHAFEHPGRAAPYARPMWTAAAFAPVLEVSAREDRTWRTASVSIDPSLLTVCHSSGHERVLMTDGWRALRLDIVEGRIGHGAVRLRFAVGGPAALGDYILALRRFDALVRQGRFGRSLHPPEPRADRMLRLLRAADALADGARQRDIAVTLLHADVGAPGWREDQPHMRLQAQRLTRDARRYLAGGYRALLGRAADTAIRFAVGRDGHPAR